MATESMTLKFRLGLTKSDPEQEPVLIVGQEAHLKSLTWQDVRCKLEPRVTEEVWQRGLAALVAGEICELWPRGATLAMLPARCSRHATPSRVHALSKIVRNSHLSTPEESVVLVCNKREALASVVGVARALPLYSARSGPSPLDPPSQASPGALTTEIQLISPLCIDDRGDSDDQPNNILSEEELATLREVAEATRLAAKITDMPTNVMDVDAFVQEACRVARSLDVPEPEVIRGEALRERGMGGLYGVGRAAQCPPALVALSYRAPGATRSVALVGKGIVYDTGGLSIKSRTAMVGMKGDCGGAAAVLAAFSVLVRAKPSVDLHAVLCLAENAVGPKATRPDDIHTLYSGRTVEINNTDAEAVAIVAQATDANGRLVLSDGVVFAQKDLKADTIVDVATLTGAQGTATGKYHAALVCNNERLEQACVRAGQASGDLAHPLPFTPELHFSEFSSVVADMKNSVADRSNAQPSCAGLFMLAHLGFDFPGLWLHVDMASPAHSGERATGYGVALLAVLFGHYTRSRLLQALSPGPLWD